jgi:hypothetical protein
MILRVWNSMIVAKAGASASTGLMTQERLCTDRTLSMDQTFA